MSGRVANLADRTCDRLCPYRYLYGHAKSAQVRYLWRVRGDSSRRDVSHVTDQEIAMVRNALRDAAMLEQYVKYLQTRVAKQRAVVAQLRECGLDPHEDQVVLENLEGAAEALARQLAQLRARPRPALALV
nr:DUF294 nucleotidyltransferase-like domain-containing protein [Cupriavidus sp. U2]